MNPDNKNIKITAHRGASAYAPENTMAAFQKAVEMGADAIELDVRLCKDDIPVVFHDKFLDRITNNEGKIRKTPYQELSKMDAGSWFHPSFKNERIPTLEHVITFLKGKVLINIEVKKIRDKDILAEQVVKILKKYDCTSQCYLTTFDIPTLEIIQNIAPDLKTGLIFRKFHNHLWDNKCELVNGSHKVVDETIVAQAKKSGKEMHIWTANTLKAINRSIELQVDNIVTNFPDIAKILLKNHQNSKKVLT